MLVLLIKRFFHLSRLLNVREDKRKKKIFDLKADSWHIKISLVKVKTALVRALAVGIINEGGPIGLRHV